MVLSARSQIMRAAAAAAAASASSPPFLSSSSPSPFSEVLSASKTAQIDCPFTSSVMAVLSDGVDGGHAQV
jgi:hypothetical protein